MAKKIISQLELIDSLLNHEFLEKGKDATQLVETGLMKRRLVLNGLDHRLYRYDADKSDFFRYFSMTSGLKKMCDYILFIEESSRLYILLIELKLGTKSATKQLVASECFIDFLLASAGRVGIHLKANCHTMKIRVSEERSKQRNRTTRQEPLIYDVNRIINYDRKDAFRIKEVLGVI